MARQTEPNPWTMCWAEQAAKEDDFVCAFCEACEVSEEGDYCSEECKALSEQEQVDDLRTTAQLDQEAR